MKAKVTAYRDRELDLDELVRAAARVLADAPSAPTDGRVREEADARTVRYYQTLGILDKPLRYDGRRAVYGYRHLLQIVTVKLLQAQGLKLEQIQRAMVRASTTELEATLVSVLGGRELREAPPPALLANLPHPAAVARMGIEEHLESASASLGEERRTLRAEEVAPGVVVLIDPDVALHPEGILESIRKVMRTKKGGAA